MPLSFSNEASKIVKFANEINLNNLGIYKVKDINKYPRSFYIKRFGNTTLLEDLKCLIPIDVDMLKVGQTYKVHIQENWDHRYFTAKFLGFDEEDNYVVKFENNKPCTIFDFREIYKVNEYANM